MIFIFLSWIVLFCCFLSFGIAAGVLLQLNSKNIAITILLGMATQTVLVALCAFFIAVGVQLFVANMLLTAILAYRFRRLLIQSLQSFVVEVKAISILLKAAMVIIVLSALLKCAQSPFIFDNEIYYIQTIKWLNEYGFVTGLGNLDIAFGQTSGWHILQAAFNFSFLTDRINDLNGFLLVICSYYFISEFDARLKEEQQFHWIGFIVVFNVLLYQFLNSPSPDLSLFLITQILLYLFLKEARTSNDTKVMGLLFVFLVFIKVTIAPIGLLFLFVFFRKKKGLGFFLITTAVFAVLWIAKNIILSGYPFYPFPGFSIESDWTVPKKLLENLNYIIKNHEFLTVPQGDHLAIFEKIIIWFRFEGINGIFNKGIILLFVLAPFTNKIRTISNYRIVYVVLLIHFMTVFLISPQFRFFLAGYIFLGALLLADIANRTHIDARLVVFALVTATILPVFASYVINLKSLTRNIVNQDPGKMSWHQVYLPERNSKFASTPFDRIKKGNLQYYTPAVPFYFYGKADGPLPCVNKNQLDYFEAHLQIIPQCRGTFIKDGFYSKKLRNDT